MATDTLLLVPVIEQIIVDFKEFGEVIKRREDSGEYPDDYIEELYTLRVELLKIESKLKKLKVGTY